MVPEDMYVEYKRYMQRMDGVDEVPEAEMKGWLKDLQSEPCVGYKLVYDPKDKAVAGFAIYSKYPDCPADCQLYIQDIYVRPESRGKGLGTELMKKVLKEKVDGKKVKRIALYVMDSNIKGREFWMKQFPNGATRWDVWVGGKLYIYDI